MNERSFSCNFYINGIQSTGQKVTDLMEPVQFDVPIDTQMQIVGKVVLAQLYYKQAFCTGQSLVVDGGTVLV